MTLSLQNQNEKILVAALHVGVVPIRTLLENQLSKALNRASTLHTLTRAEIRVTTLVTRERNIPSHGTTSWQHMHMIKHRDVGEALSTRNCFWGASMPPHLLERASRGPNGGLATTHVPYFFIHKGWNSSAPVVVCKHTDRGPNGDLYATHAPSPHRFSIQESRRSWHFCLTLSLKERPPPQ